MIHRSPWRKPALGKAWRISPALYKPLLAGLGDTYGLDTIATAPGGAAGYETVAPAGGPVLLPSSAVTAQALAQMPAGSIPGATGPIASSSTFNTLANDISALAQPVVKDLTTPFYNSAGQLVNPITGNVMGNSISSAIAAIGPTGLIIGGVVIVGLIIASSKSK